MSFNLSELERQTIKERLNFGLLIIGGAFLLLLIRFWLLQWVQHETWSNIAENNRIRQVTIPSMRGNIYDRRGKIIAEWEPSYNVTIIPADKTDESLFMLSKILSTPVEALEERMEKNRSWSPFIPVLVAEDISLKQYAQVEENSLVLSGVDTDRRPIRKYYADSALVSHILGYLGEISREKLAAPEFEDYRPGDRVGVTGIERSMEKTLRGTSGKKFKLVDARGRELSIESGMRDLRGRLDYYGWLKNLEAMNRPRLSGDSVALTIDLRLQRIAREHMGNHTGSVVVMDVKTGELIVLLSTPGYDPADFVGGISKDKWEAYQDEKSLNPLLDRSIQGLYPPASIFKIVMTAAALEEREIRPSASFDCNGSYILFDTTFGCWKWTGHGKIDLETSLVESCDVYYYKLGEKVGVLKIAEWARRFGLGEKVRIGLVEEKAGLIPDPEWKRRRYNKPWYDGETLLVSVGQGAMQITPLQAVLIPASVANNGTIMRPQLIHHLKDENGVPKTEFKPQVMAENIMGPSTVGFLRRAMEKVVEDKAGTAYKYARSGYVRIAAKTGTSEVSKKYKRKPLEEIPYKYRDHAWFVAYAPAHAPRIAVVVLVEHGGSGGAIAGPIARAIIEDYFRIVASDALNSHKKNS